MKFKHQWSTIPPISTKRTTISYLKSMNKKTKKLMTYGIRLGTGTTMWWV
jgi:hypothetical protein